MGEYPALSVEEIEAIAAQRSLMAIATTAAVSPAVLNHLDWLACWAS